jgi:phage repressor protein C with HTH and peptisase S24 domain
MWENEVDRLRKLQAARLKEARRLRGYKTASDAARRFNWSVATYVSHENGTRGVGRMYREYAKKLRVNAAWLLGHSEERDSIVRGVTVVADAAVGTWKESPSPPTERGRARTVSVPSHENHDDERFAVRVADASINKVLPQGCFAVCIPTDDSATFYVGQVVYVERIREGMMELSLRRVSAVSTSGSLKLTTYSQDPKFKQDLTFPSSKNDERLRIVGRVVGKYEDL